MSIMVVGRGGTSGRRVLVQEKRAIKISPLDWVHVATAIPFFVSGSSLPSRRHARTTVYHTPLLFASSDKRTTTRA